MDKETQRPIPVTRKSEDELKQIALRIAKNQLFIDRYITPADKLEMIGKVFTPLLKVEPQNMLLLQEQVGLFFAESDSAAAKVVSKSNIEYPMFGTIRMIHKDDMEVLSKWLSHYTPEIQEDGIDGKNTNSAK